MSPKIVACIAVLLTLGGGLGCVNSGGDSAGTVNTGIDDTTTPSMPQNLVATAMGSGAVSLEWNVSQDPESGVAAYEVYRDGELLYTTTETSYVDSTLDPETTYSYGVLAVNDADLVSGSATDTTTTLVQQDTTPPSTPADLTIVTTSSTTTRLTWSASQDPESAVANYEILRDGNLVDTTTETAYNDSALEAETTYEYDVAAINVDGLRSSPASNSVTTSATGDPGDAAPIGINGAYFLPWEPQVVFVDAFMTSERLVTYRADNIFARTDVAFPADENGYPLEIPYDPDGAGSSPAHVVRTRMAMHEFIPPGEYTLFFNGTGTIRLGNASLVDCSSVGSGSCTVDITPSSGGIVLYILESDPADPIRQISVVMPGFASTYEAEPFYPTFIDRLQGMRALRLMNLIRANHYLCDNGFASDDAACLTFWSERTPLGHHDQTSLKGLAWEHMIDLVNAAGVDPWINLPHNADDNYMAQLAALFHQRLAPERRIYLELSNEVWNGAMTQEDYFINVGVAAEYAPGDAPEAGRRAFAKRCAEMWEIFENEFAGEEDRVVNILPSFAASAGESVSLFNALEDPQFNPNGIEAEALAIAPYFGAGIASQILANGEENTITVDEILDRAEQAVYSETQVFTQNHKAIADDHGMLLYAYEGGQHLVDGTRTPALVDKLIEANRDARMSDITRQMFDVWFANGGDLFMYFDYVRRPADHGSWGALEWQDQPIEDAPKFQAIRDLVDEFTAD